MAEDIDVRASGSRVHRTAQIRGGHRVKVAGRTELAEDVVARGDLALIRLGKESVIGARTTLQPPRSVRGGEDEYLPLLIGSFTCIGQDCLIEASFVGSNVLIGDNVTVGARVRINDGCCIAADAVIPPDTVIPPFAVVEGNPARVVAVQDPQ